MSNRLKVDESTVQYRSGYSSANGRFAYVRQRHVNGVFASGDGALLTSLLQNGVPFVNAVANVAFKGDRAVTFGSSFVKPSKYLIDHHLFARLLMLSFL